MSSTIRTADHHRALRDGTGRRSHFKAQAFGGWIGEQFGWRSPFVIVALYVIASAGLARELKINRRRGTFQTSANDRACSQRSHRRCGDRRSARARRLFYRRLSCFGASAYITTMLHQRFGMSFGQAGLALAAFGAGGLAYAVSARHVVPRLGETGVAQLAAGLFLVLRRAGLRADAMACCASMLPELAPPIIWSTACFR